MRAATWFAISLLGGAGCTGGPSESSEPPTGELALTSAPDQDSNPSNVLTPDAHVDGDEGDGDGSDGLDGDGDGGQGLPLPPRHGLGECFELDTEGWVVEVLATDVPFAAQVDALTGADGTLHIAYVSGENVYYQKRTGDGWVRELLDTGRDYAWGVDIEQDAQGTLHVVAGGHDGVRYFRAQSGSFERTLVWDGFTRQVDLALSAQGVPHIVHTNEDDRGLRYSTPDGAAWTTETIDERGYPRGANLFVGADGVAEVLYYNGWLAYARRAVDGWTVRDLGVGIDPHAVHDGSGALVAAWGGHEDDTVTIARLEAGDVVTTTTLDVPGTHGAAMPGVALAANGDLHVALRSATGYRYLLATADGVESTEIMQAWTDYPARLTVDAQGAPHLFLGYGVDRSFGGELLHAYRGVCPAP